MIASPPAPIKTEDIPIDQIDAGDNHRLVTPTDEAKILELTESIRTHGQQTPGRVYEPENEEHPYLLGFGWRRLQAAKRAGLTTFRAEVYPMASREEIAAAKAVENLHRKDLNAAEEVVIVTELLKLHKGDRSMVASILGMSEKWVADRHYLTRLDQRVLEMVAAGFLPLGHARLIAQVGDVKQQFSIAESVSHAYARKERFKVGSITVDSIDELRSKIATVTRQLNRVPWKLDQPFDDDKKPLPACTGCPNNTKSDATLFEGAGDPKAEAGSCLNAGCYEEKTARFEKLKLTVSAKLIKKPPTTALASAVRDEVPTWAKPEPVQRAVKKAAESGSTPAAGAKGGTAGAPKMTEEERRNKALVQYNQKFQDWRHKVVNAMKDSFVKSPLRAAVLDLIRAEKVWSDQRYCIETHNYNPGKQPTAPTKLPEVNAAVVGLIRLLKDGNEDAVIQLAKKTNAKNVFENHRWNLANMSPHILLRLAESLDVEIDPLPNFEDSLPKDLRSDAAGTTDKPATSKKSKTKKQPAAAAPAPRRATGKDAAAGADVEDRRDEDDDE